MRFVEPAAAAATLLLRLIAVPWRGWGFDWIVVGALLWAALIAAGERSGPRKAALGVASFWLVGIYAIHQGRTTFWLFAGP